MTIDTATATKINGWAVGRRGRGTRLHLAAGSRLTLCGAGNNNIRSALRMTGGALDTVTCKCCLARLDEMVAEQGAPVVARDGAHTLRADGRMYDGDTYVGTVRVW